MKKLSSLLVALAAGIALFGAVTSAHATKIEYTQTGNTLNFTVFNDTLLTPISFFDVFFGVTTDDGLNFTNGGAFSNVSNGFAPVGWHSEAFAPSALDNPWLYSGILSGGSPIDTGDSLGVFSTTFTLKTNATASVDGLWFKVYDENFDEIGHGRTTLHFNGGNPVPEPSTMLLLGAGLAGLALYRRKRT